MIKINRLYNDKKNTDFIIIKKNGTYMIKSSSSKNIIEMISKNNFSLYGSYPIKIYLSYKKKEADFYLVNGVFNPFDKRNNRSLKDKNNLLHCNFSKKLMKYQDKQIIYMAIYTLNDKYNSNSKKFKLNNNLRIFIRGNYMYPICNLQPNYDRLKYIIKKEKYFLSNKWEYSTEGYILVLFDGTNGICSPSNSNNLNINNWKKIIRNIRKDTDKKILLRFHPGNKSISISENLKKKINIEILPNNINLYDIRKDIYLVICNNTNLKDSFLAWGIPTYIFNQKNITCQYLKDIVINSLHFNHSDLPNITSRNEYLARIANFLWYDDEIKNGNCFKYLYQNNYFDLSVI